MSAADRARSPPTSPAAWRRPVLGIDREEAPLAEARAGAAGLTNVRFARGDIFALDVVPGSYDVVHVHQVLQHLVDPIAALVELRLVCRPGGVVAARDGDYASMTWYPHDPLLDRWQDLYQRVARANGGEPDAGRRLLAWAHGAGFEDVRASASSWCFATPEARAWWADLWADRVTQSRFAQQALGEGHAARAATQAIRSRMIPALAGEPDAWFGDAPRRGALHRARRTRQGDRGIPMTVTAPVLDEPDQTRFTARAHAGLDRHAQGRGRRGRQAARPHELPRRPAKCMTMTARMATEALAPRRPVGGA